MSLKHKAYKDACLRFLNENANHDDVIELDNGVQYRIITQGKGLKPNLKSTVRVHYKGSLIDGKVFDDTFRDNHPVSFKVRDVIEGWQSALLEMAVGSHWIIYIPYYLGYGTRNEGPIKAYSTLIFEIQLLGVK